MAFVVFFRAVNVGGYQKFQPSALAKKLADLDVVNIGAAGTWVVRGRTQPTKLRQEILRHMPFEPGLMICPADDVLALSREDPFPKAPAGTDVQRFVTVLQAAPRTLPPLPAQQPPGNKWEVRLVAITGHFALSFRRPGPKGVYPNALIEKQLGIPATTRSWNTIASICRVLGT